MEEGFQRKRKESSETEARARRRSRFAMRRGRAGTRSASASSARCSPSDAGSCSRRASRLRRSSCEGSASISDPFTTCIRYALYIAPHQLNGEYIRHGRARVESVDLVHKRSACHLPLNSSYPQLNGSRCPGQAPWWSRRPRQKRWAVCRRTEEQYRRLTALALARSHPASTGSPLALRPRRTRLPAVRYLTARHCNLGTARRGHLQPAGRALGNCKQVLTDRACSKQQPRAHSSADRVAAHLSQQPHNVGSHDGRVQRTAFCRGQGAQQVSAERSA